MLLFTPGAATAQEAAAPATAPASAPATAASAAADEAKHDQGTVRTVDPQRGTCITDMADGPVTYDVSQAQLIDAAGKPAGVATAGLKPGDKVLITYSVDTSCAHAPACRGAMASEVRLLK